MFDRAQCALGTSGPPPFRPLPLRYHYGSDPNSCRNASFHCVVAKRPSLSLPRPSVPSSVTMHLNSAPVTENASSIPFDLKRFLGVAHFICDSISARNSIWNTSLLRAHENNSGEDFFPNISRKDRGFGFFTFLTAPNDIIFKTLYCWNVSCNCPSSVITTVVINDRALNASPLFQGS